VFAESSGKDGMYPNLQKDLSELSRVVRDIVRLRPDVPVNPVLFSAFDQLYRQAREVGAPELAATRAWSRERRPSYRALGLALDRIRDESSQLLAWRG
jgi:hypothetical protein